MNSAEYEQNSGANSFPDWISLYNNIQNIARIPGTASETITQNQAVIRDMYVNLGDVYNKLSTQGVNPSTVSIYADVVHIPANYRTVLNGTALIIAARRVEVVETAKVSLDYRNSQTAKLIVYTNELVGSIQAVVITSTNPQGSIYRVEPVESKGVMIAYRNGTPTRQSLDTLQGGVILEIGSEFYLSLASIFQFATVLFDKEPIIAHSMFKWISSSTAGVKNLEEMFLKSSSLQVMLESSSGNTTFVPYLSQTLYTNLAKAFVEVAKAYERQYERFSDKNEAIEARKEAAMLMLDHYRDTSEFADKLIVQAQSNFDNAVKALRTAESRLKSQEYNVDLAKVTFQYGLKEWQYDQKLQAVFQGIGAVLSFAAAIPALFAGHPEMALAAVASVPATLQSVAKAMEMLANITSALQDIVAASEKIKEASNNLSQAASVEQLMAEIGNIGNDDLSGSVYWEKFQLEAERLLAEAINNNVPGARDYKLQLDILAIYGKSLSANQLAVVRISQELVRLNLQKQVSKKQEQRLSDYVNGLSASQQPNADMMQMFYQRYLDVKGALFIAFTNYSWAYKYWALRDSQLKPSIVNNVAELNNDLANIQRDYNIALERFNPPPQKFFNKTYSISAPEVLESLKQNKKATWPMTLDNPTFSGFGRVRLSTLRVWLEGARPQGKPIYISISNSGNYRDRFQGQNYQFTAAPLQRVFQYRVNSIREPRDPDWQFSNGEYGYVEVDGQVVDELQYAYFEPTPFSNWEISLPGLQNPSIDLSGVTQIVMEFAGSVIGSNTYRLMLKR